MKLNNRGMTLVEIVVAFAILGVVSVSIFSMMLTSTKTYTNLTYNTQLKYNAQIAMANIEKRVMNCNEGISWNDSQKALFIVNEEGEERELEVFCLNKDTGELRYGKGNLGAGVTSTNLDFYLLAENVSNMSVTFVDSPSSSDIRIQAEIEITMERNDKTYLSKKIVALRNQPGNCGGILSGINVTVN